MNSISSPSLNVIEKEKLKKKNKNKQYSSLPGITSNLVSGYL